MNGSMLLLLCALVGVQGSLANTTSHLATDKSNNDLQIKEQLINEMPSIQLQSYRAFQSKEANCRNNQHKNGGFYDPYVDTCRSCAHNCTHGDKICQSKCREYFKLEQVEKENENLTSDLNKKKVEIQELNQKMNFFIAVAAMVFISVLIFGFWIGRHFYKKLSNKISDCRHDNPQGDIEEKFLTKQV